MTQAFPLHWPQNWPRTAEHRRETSQFGEVSWTAAINELQSELRRLKATNIIISTDTELRNDGMPYANQKPADPGIAAWFVLDGETRCIPCDRWKTQKENIRAITKTINAMRGIDRWGTGEMLKRQFDAFAALPAPNNKRVLWWEILGIPRNSTKEAIMIAFRKKAQHHHPDAPNGSHEDMAALNAARDAALQDIAA